MRMMVIKAGNASADCSHLMRTTFIIMSAPTVMSAGPIAYGGTFAVEATHFVGYLGAWEYSS